MIDLFTQEDPDPIVSGDAYSRDEQEEFRPLIQAAIDRTMAMPIGEFPALTEEHRAKYLRHLADALKRIDNGTYGICRVTGKRIAKYRLRNVLHATISVERPCDSDRAEIISGSAERLKQERGPSSASPNNTL